MATGPGLFTVVCNHLKPTMLLRVARPGACLLFGRVGVSELGVGVCWGAMRDEAGGLARRAGASMQEKGGRRRWLGAARWCWDRACWH
jgi:hypothetical protein